MWVNSNNTGLVYDLNGKKSKLVVGYREEEIEEISIGQKVRQKFETSLEDVSDSKLKTIADFDKKYQLQTKEVVLVKTERGWLLYSDSEGWGKLCSRFNLIRPRLLRFQHQKFQKEMSFSQGRGSKSFCWKMEDI